MLTDDLPLLDQHCHGVRDADLDRAGFELLMTEASRLRTDGPFHSMLGVTLRRLCAPVLDLERHAPVDEYLARRAELGWREVTRRLLRASGTHVWLVDTGLPDPSLTAVAELATLGGGAAREVLRLETIAEQVAATGTSVTGLIHAVEAELRARAGHAVGLKTIAAYRGGLRLPAVRPSPVRVRSAVSTWLASDDRRIQDPVLLAWLAHLGVEIGAEFGLPLQIHTGFGDADLHLAESDPTLLTEFLRATVDTGVAIVLLHCWPYHRNAAYLAHVFPHVLVDLGLTIPYVGSRVDAVLGETLELAPWAAVCFSSDGYGLPELHHLGAVLWRQRCGRLLDRWLAEDALAVSDAERLARGMAGDNAARRYGLDWPPG